MRGHCTERLVDQELLASEQFVVVVLDLSAHAFDGLAGDVGFIPLYLLPDQYAWRVNVGNAHVGQRGDLAIVGVLEVRVKEGKLSVVDFHSRLVGDL